MNLFTPRRPRRFHHEYIYSDERKALLETIRNKAEQTKTSSKAYCNKAEQDKTHLENVQNKAAQSFTATDTHPTYHQTLRGAFASQLKYLQHTNNALRTPLHATSMFIFLLILATLTLVIYLFG